jgi:hypothetical protein
MDLLALLPGTAGCLANPPPLLAATSQGPWRTRGIDRIIGSAAASAKATESAREEAKAVQTRLSRRLRELIPQEVSSQDPACLFVAGTLCCFERLSHCSKQLQLQDNQRSALAALSWQSPASPRRFFRSRASACSFSRNTLPEAPAINGLHSATRETPASSLSTRVINQLCHYIQTLGAQP